MSGTMAAAHELVIIPEGMIADLLTRQAAFDAVEAVFAGMA
jgi:alanine dehydrogenase